MRILHVIPSLARSHGGPSSVIRGLAKAQREAGACVTVFTGYGRDDRGEAPPVFGRPINRDDLNVWQFPLDGGAVCNLSESCRLLANAVLRRAHEFDIVHIHSLWNLCVAQATLACRLRRIPYAITVHGGLDPWLMRKRAFLRRRYLATVERHRLRHAALVHFTTDAEIKSSGQYASMCRSVVVPLGVDQCFFSAGISRAAARRSFGLGDSRFVLLQAGRFHPVKGLDVLVAAWPRVLEVYPDSLLWLVGPGDPRYIAELKALAGRFGVSTSVRFDSQQNASTLATAYAAADVVALSSHKENFGLTIAEAMAVGRPVLAAEGVNLASDIHKCGCGMVSPLSADALAQNLLGLLSMGESELEKMGRRGRRWAAEHYNWGSIAHRMLNAYEVALRTRREEVA